MANLKTLTQKYALYAFECIEEVKTKNLEKDYSPRVKKLPAMITHNGLLTTLAFLYSKAEFNKDGTIKDANALLLKHLVKWLDNAKGEIKKENISNFIQNLAAANFQQLMLYSQRALTLSQWLKRLAEGEFEDEDTKG